MMPVPVSPDRYLSRIVAMSLTAILLQGLVLTPFLRAENRKPRVVRQNVIRISKKRYRRDKGSLPRSLAGLAPAYALSIQDAPLSGKPLHYQIDQGGFLLYSVGRNGVADQGRSYEEANRLQGTRPDGDDIVVRVRDES